MEQPNLSYIDSLSGGDKDFKQKLIGIIKKEYPEEKDIYLTNIKKGNYKQAASNVHKLKHKISILGLEKSYDIAANYEANLLEDNIDLKQEFEAILNVITNYLQQL